MQATRSSRAMDGNTDTSICTSPEKTRTGSTTGAHKLPALLSLEAEAFNHKQEQYSTTNKTHDVT